MFIICVSALIAVIACIIFIVLDMEANASIACGFVVFVLFLFALNIIEHSQIKLIQNCKEESKLVVPKISYANDSSFKVLKYDHNKFEQKIRIQKSDSLYNLNDSEYIIEPCEQIILKRSR